MAQIEPSPRTRRTETVEKESPPIVPGPRPAPPRRSRWRLPLLVLGPLVAVAIALGIYFSGGRYVSEENAYVGEATVAVAPQVSGIVSRVNVKQNERVEADTVLFVIDPEPYRIALNGARAQLGITRAQISSQVDTYRAATQQAEQAQATLTFARQQLQRMQELVGRGAGTQVQLDTARRDEQVAAASLASAQAQAEAALAQIGGDADAPVEQRPQYQAAQANVASAERNLRLTEIKAPFAGVVTNVNSIDVGAFLNAGQQAMSMVATDQPWVDVNVRETDLTHVQAGDPATIVVDAYPDMTFNGRIATINPASGAVFALIPPQNATGNWVKVVQRIPVRVGIDWPSDAPLLRTGMSATVTIDTGNRRTLATLWRDIRDWL
jgi:membrane fusion protein (multidrug efflux system)